MQDAYVAEQSTVGTWAMIGFIAPGARSAQDQTGSTTAFTYTGGAAAVTTECPEGYTNASGVCQKTDGENTSTAAAIGGSVEGGFVAESRAKLNDCLAGTQWTIDAKVTTGTAVYTPKIGGKAPADNAECNALTPQYANIGK